MFLFSGVFWLNHLDKVAHVILLFVYQVVLSTNIAFSIYILLSLPSCALYDGLCVVDRETSITINDVKYVVDTGKMRQMTFDATKQISVLEEAWVSVAQSEQRKGRAGRVGPGML